MTPATEASRGVDDAVVALGDGCVALLGGRCDGCQRTHFPTQPCCPYCGQAVHQAQLPVSGTVHAVTTTTLPVPGSAAPTTIAMVTLCADVIVQGVVEQPVDIGDVVGMVEREVAGPDGPLLGIAFSARGPHA